MISTQVRKGVGGRGDEVGGLGGSGCRVDWQKGGGGLSVGFACVRLKILWVLF